jgi:hypothetical protein
MPLHLARGFILFLRDSIQAHARGRPVFWLSIEKVIFFGISHFDFL